MLMMDNLPDSSVIADIAVTTTSGTLKLSGQHLQPNKIDTSLHASNLPDCGYTGYEVYVNITVTFAATSKIELQSLIATPDNSAKIRINSVHRIECATTYALLIKPG